MASLYNLYLGVFILFSVLVILPNLAFIGCVLGSHRLRTTVPHLLMVSIAGMDLLLGCFILPMLIRSLVETEAPICHLHTTLQAIGDYGLFFICGWSFVTLDIIFLAAMLCPSWVCSKPRLPTCVKHAVLCLWPWVVCFLILIPIIFLDTPYEPIHRHHWKDPMCLSNFPRTVQILLDTLCLHMPLITSALIVITLIGIFIKREISLISVLEEPALMEDSNGAGAGAATAAAVPSRRSYSHDPSNTAITNHPLSVCLPNLVYFLCYIPVALGSFMTLDFSGAGPSTAQASLLVLIPMLTRSAALPFTWLSMATVRHEASEWMVYLWNAMTRCCCRMPGIPSASVSYTGLREVQTA